MIAEHSGGETEHDRRGSSGVSCSTVRQALESPSGEPPIHRGTAEASFVARAKTDALSDLTSSRSLPASPALQSTSHLLGALQRPGEIGVAFWDETPAPRARRQPSPPGSAPARWRRLGVAGAFVAGRLVAGDVAIEEDRVAAIGLPGSGRGLALPGLVDLQVNGYAGIDALSASERELVEMGRALARDGVLAYLPTLISSEPSQTKRALRRLDQLGRRPVSDGAQILGVHLEGPFLAPERAGTHPLDRLRAPDVRLSGELLAAGPVRMVTLAPELEGALGLVALLTRRGVVVSLGHSAASAVEARLAFDAGAVAVTHCWNAMAPVSARAPGLVGAALSDARAAIQLIADGAHVADELVRLSFAAAPGRCSIVTDATSLARAPTNDALMLGGIPITARDGVARRPDGTLAGGASSLLFCLARLVELGIQIEDAFAAVTERPARLVGRRDVGHLAPGGRADLIVLDDALELRQVLVSGHALSP